VIESIFLLKSPVLTESLFQSTPSLQPVLELPIVLNQIVFRGAGAPYNFCQVLSIKLRKSCIRTLLATVSATIVPRSLASNTDRPYFQRDC
jgi:hypothetical protein